jgi:uncharacterized protein with FMN-binding domain
MSKKVIIGIACAAVVIISYFGGKYLYDTAKYKKIVADIAIKTPDISHIENGTYNGSFDAILISANVDVTVNDHEITAIKIIEHKNDRGLGAEVITDEVMLKQHLEVDTVSGATNSSKVILKAIENALESGMKS